jgi:Ca2+-binding RTX toxin-like protein
MAVVTGTTGTDTLIGTDDADVLRPMGTTVAGDREVLRGLDGADIYDLIRNATASTYDFVIDDQGTDGGADALVNVGKLYQSASLGYAAYASAVRIGDDLIIHTPSKPHRFRDPAQPDYDIEIRNHYGSGHVETLQSGGITYALVAGPTGTALADFMVGTNAADSFSSGAGDDWLFGNGGWDVLTTGAGHDTVFGGNGRDDIRAGAGNDILFGDRGNDQLRSGDGADRAEGGTGSDRIWGGAGADWLSGGDGRDIIRGGAGQDNLTGSAGNDLLIGGKEGDTYRFAARAGDPGWGDDVIRDAGNAASYKNADTIELSGLYGPSDGNAAEAFARLSFARSGDDMLLTVDDGLSSLRAENMFHADTARWDIETLELQAGYWSPIVFQILNGAADAIGDDRDAANGGYGGAANELMFGSEADDDFFGDAGTNFIWTGAGADTLIYKENDSANWGGYGGGQSHDIVEDFDIAADKLDFREIKSVTSLADLTVGQDADGNATIRWASGDFQVSSILIELRGVDIADVSSDIFVFV